MGWIGQQGALEDGAQGGAVFDEAIGIIGGAQGEHGGIVLMVDGCDGAVEVGSGAVAEDFQGSEGVAEQEIIARDGGGGEFVSGRRWRGRLGSGAGSRGQGSGIELVGEEESREGAVEGQRDGSGGCCGGRNGGSEVFEGGQAWLGGVRGCFVDEIPDDGIKEQIARIGVAAVPGQRWIRRVIVVHGR